MVRRRGGFSLIELLVVIAIIGVLSAMLFPVFLSARERARRTYCVNNMRQIYMAIRMYADDYAGYMPLFPKDVSSRRDRSVQRDGFSLLKSYCKTSRTNIFLCPLSGTRNGQFMNPAAQKAAMLNEPPYDVVFPDRTVWQCSYHFYPRVYSYPTRSGDGWTQGRLDCNLTDRDLFLNKNYTRTQAKKAIEIGGPLVDNYLHFYSRDEKVQYGVLTLTVKGTVKFLPKGQHPW